MAKLGAALGIGGIVAVLGGAFLHYNQSYSLTLPTEEGWLHVQPRHYPEEFQDAAGVIRDHVYQAAMPGAEVSALSQTVHPWERVSMDIRADDLRASFEQALRITSFSKCRGVPGEPVTWLCREWNVDKGDVTFRQRLYFARRGNTVLAVVFTAAPGHFRDVGDPHGWLENLEWHGPSIAYAF